MQLLLIDGAQGSGELLAQRLAPAGFKARLASSVNGALGNGENDNFMAVLIDHGRSAPPAAEVVAPLRSAGIDQPLLVLSARDDWREKVACLDAGADDFLVKPVRSEEVAARLRALIRRNAGASTDRIISGDIDLDLRRQCAWKGGHCLDLTRNEFRLLRLFLFGPNQVLRKAQIRDALWGTATDVSDNAIEVQVARLRRKLGPASIQTLRGLGYRMNAGQQGDETTAPCDPCLHESQECGCE